MRVLHRRNMVAEHGIHVDDIPAFLMIHQRRDLDLKILKNDFFVRK
jgi:hypothetical protein